MIDNITSRVLDRRVMNDRYTLSPCLSSFYSHLRYPSASLLGVFLCVVCASACECVWVCVCVREREPGRLIGVFLCVLCESVCMRVWVCVCERERERERESHRSLSVCCVCECLWVCVCERERERERERIIGVFLCVVWESVAALPIRTCMSAPCASRYGVATISRLLKMIGLFCRISSLL